MNTYYSEKQLNAKASTVVLGVSAKLIMTIVLKTLRQSHVYHLPHKTQDSPCTITLIPFP